MRVAGVGPLLCPGGCLNLSGRRFAGDFESDGGFWPRDGFGGGGGFAALLRRALGVVGRALLPVVVVEVWERRLRRSVCGVLVGLLGVLAVLVVVWRVAVFEAGTVDLRAGERAKDSSSETGKSNAPNPTHRDMYYHSKCIETEEN